MRTHPLSPEEIDGARRGPRSRVVRFAARAGMTLALTAGLTGVVVAPAQAANPYERGPAPTESSVTAEEGYFDTDEESVSSLVSGFGGGTIYYPTDTSEGTFGGVVIAPGYTASQSSMAWMGHRIASQGFVVFTIDTNTRYDQPDSRGAQIEAALDYLVDDSDVSDQVDGDRMAVMGHSMGGGGAMSAALRRPSLKAAVGLAPFSPSQNLTSMQVPTMLLAGQRDTTVTPAGVTGLYNGIPTTTEKAYLELTGAGHAFPTSSNSVMMRKVIPWLKIFVDQDTRYGQFLCPLMDWTGITAYRGSCPLDPGGTGSATRHEAEDSPAVCTGTIDSDHAGYSGAGFCNGDNAVGASAQFTVDASTTATATLRVRYANGTTTARPASLIVNGSTVGTPSFGGTGAWTTWSTSTLTVTLNAGSNTIRFDPTTAGGLPNIDYLDVVTS